MTYMGLRVDEWINLGLAVLSVVAAVTIGRWMINLVFVRWSERLAQRTKTELDDLVIEAARLPAYWFLVVAVTHAALGWLDFVPVDWRATSEKIFFVLYTFIAFVLMWRVIAGLFDWYGKELASRTETNLDEQLLPIVRRITLLALAIVVLSMVLQRFNIQVTGLVATLGIGSLAIALAAQASLSDIFSGFVIMVDRPYRIGDRIELQDLGTWGDVTDIGLRSTRIRTRDNRMVIIPNSVIGKSLIINHSYPDSHYRIEVNVGIGYGSDIEKARRLMVEAAQGVEGVRRENPVEALFVEMGDSALLFRIRVWIQSYTDTRRIVDRVNTAVYQSLTEAGVEIPFPQVDVHHYVDPAKRDLIKRTLGGS